MEKKSKSWDVFISYASEDREEVVAPLAELFQSLGLKVWYDKTELRVGDSLRERIDEGLSQSRYGIVVLSCSFFNKHYPVRELNGLAQLEVDGRKVILPVWRDVDEKIVRDFSPPLADRVAARWSDGIYEVAKQLIEVVRPDLTGRLNDLVTREIPLAPVDSGQQIVNLLGDALVYRFHNEAAETEEESDMIVFFIKQMQEWGERLSECGADTRVRAEYNLHQTLKEIYRVGWSVWGTMILIKRKNGRPASAWPTAVISIVKGKPRAVFSVNGKAIVIKND